MLQGCASSADAEPRGEKSELRPSSSATTSWRPLRSRSRDETAASYLGFVQIAAIRLRLEHLVNSASSRNTRIRTAHQLPDARSA